MSGRADPCAVGVDFGTMSGRAAIAATREQVAALHSGLVRYGLGTRTAGNISGRAPGAKLFAIKPLGVSCDELTPRP